MTTKSTVLILGASRGLGLAMAEEWLKRDAKVIATQRSASPGLSGLQGRYPGSVEIATVDIVEAATVHTLREASEGAALTCSSSMPAFAKPARRRRPRWTSATSST
jgi:NAD(P)-dependent dehydrogenase (short-subunit alcohol dehydrogenase family)